MIGPIEVARTAVEALEAAGHVVAVGDALALGIWSQPRATLDADINVFVLPADHASATRALLDAGFTLDANIVHMRWQNGDVAPAKFGSFHVDLFAPSIPFYSEAERRIRRVSFGDYSLPFLSPDVLAVFKLLINRGKDRTDLETLLRDAGADIGRAWVRSQVAVMMGEDDERVAFWDSLCETIGPVG